MKSKNAASGLTLIETVIATAILFLIGASLISLGLQALSAANSAKLKNQAVLYAKQKVEDLRYQRDNQGWLDFLSAQCGARTDSLPAYGQANFFQREALLTTDNGCLGNQASLTVTVRWREKNQDKNVRLITKLANWQ